MYWLLVVLVGGVAAINDITINNWGEKLSLRWWLVSAAVILVFMTGYGLAMKLGAERRASLSVVVITVLVINIAGVTLWTHFTGTKLTGLQWLGVAMALAAVALLEFGKPQ